MTVGRMMMAWRLSPCSAVHAEVLAALHATCFDPPWSTAAMARVIAMPSAFGFLAQEEKDGDGSAHGDPNAPCGFVLCQAAGGVCEILSIGVSPAHRRRKLGHRLLKEALDEAARKGAARMFLEVRADNGPARGFYTAHGFAQVGRRRDYYTTPGAGRVDALVLGRELM